MQTPPRSASPHQPPPFPMATFTDQETLNRQFELFEQSHMAVRDFFLREDQLLGEERRKFEEWKQAQQAWLEQQNSELANRQGETKAYEEELQQLERDIQARERQTSKQQQTFQQNQRQLQLAQQQHAQQLQQQQQLIKQQQDQLAATQHNQAQQMAQLQAQEAEQQKVEAQLEQQRQQQAGLREMLGQRAGAFQQQAQSLQAQNQMAQAQSLHNRASTRTLLNSNMGAQNALVGPGNANGPPVRPPPNAHTYIQDREEPKSIAIRQTTGDQAYTDPDFPPTNTSLFSGPSAPGTSFGRAAYDAVWRRAGELFPNAPLFSGNDGGPTGADAIQGAVGDLWFLNALSCVATNVHMIRNLVVNEFPEVGMYEFRFWKGGRWVSVVIDDHLPLSVITQEPLFSRCSSGELWIPLMEKAYAKLHGAYQSLNGGSTHYAMVDLTGGVAEKVAMNSQGGRALNRCGGVQEKLQQARAEGWLVGVIFKSEGINLGLLPGRAYPLLEVNDTTVRLRNPWGTVPDGPPEVRETTFWIQMGDLEASLASLVICRTYNYNYGEPYYMSADLDGYWGGQNAGGQVSMANPQYIITAPEEASAFVFVSQYDPCFQQQDRDVETNPSYRKPNFGNPSPNLCTGVFVLKNDSSQRMNNPTGNVLNRDVVKYATFVFGRQSSSEFRIPSGRSMTVMPAQFQAGVEAPYQIYVFADRPFSMVKTLGEGMEQTMPLFSIAMSTPPPCIAWDPGFRNRVIVERQINGEVLEEDDEMR